LRGVWAVRWPVVLARQADPSTGRRMMTQRLDPRSDRPLSLQLADVLRAEIQEGIRRPGSQLPTESEFQRDYGVSRTTIRAALSTLAAEGLVVTRKGFGSYVRDRPPAGHQHPSRGYLPLGNRLSIKFRLPRGPVRGMTMS